ncbi:hypothetical protein QBC34DRAFT_443134 [Podospora aff. communis PSN243]|uniref:Retrovirus-related Pol polyprotein from transposon TNT 1-94-like beta-barrel domain-containing protein n=1 Tax=Podospora aff. communis PSN243 TaxID=3040156 RepID=A0AAV9G5E4_9PEZI|nr:hypothetical protein QBC34DRAFT_443134 [Podospora aff. communis PSN243]
MEARLGGMSTSTSTDGLCPDWVLSTGTNVPIAINRGWFTEYHPFKSHLTPVMGGQNLEVVGWGTVELKIKKEPNRSGHSTIRMDLVLHAPKALCNIISPVTPNFHAETGRMSNGTAGWLKNHSNQRLGYFIDHPKCGLTVLKLSGPPVGPALKPTTLETGIMYGVSVQWPKSEQEKWLQAREVSSRGAPKASVSGGTSKNGSDAESSKPAESGKSKARKSAVKSATRGKSLDTTPSDAAPKTEAAKPYTAEERKWLKLHFNDEFKFLQIHGLSIYEEKDRIEGQGIVRAMMSSDRVQKPLKPERIVHYRDVFSEEEMEYAREIFGGIGCFLYTNKLRFYDEEHRERAKKILQIKMRWEEEFKRKGGRRKDDETWRMPEGHFVDTMFSDEELEFIEKRWGNSESFMLSLGLNLVDEETSLKARDILGILMG